MNKVLGEAKISSFRAEKRVCDRLCFVLSKMFLTPDPLKNMQQLQTKLKQTFVR